MVPTLRDGDRLLVRYDGQPVPGNLAVVRLPDDPHGRPRPVAVKRLLRREAGAEGGPGWWVERDNPDEGVDSWLVGAVPDADVLAVVVARVWPRPALAAALGRR